MKLLVERVQKRAAELNHSDPHFADKLYEAMEFSKNEFETNGLETGFLLVEKSTPLTLEKAVDHMKSDPAFKKLEDRDIEDLAKYFIDQGAGSLIFAPDALSNFIDFSVRVGFPVTLGGADRGGLHTPRYETKTMLRILVGAHVLTVSEVSGVDALDAKHSGEELKIFKENPKEKVDVYEYDLGFLREVGYVLRQLGIKEDSINQKSFTKRMKEKAEDEMKPDRDLDDLEKKIESLSNLAEVDKKKDDEEDPEEEDPKARPEKEPRSDSEADMFKEIDDDMVDKFVDGMLIVLGELEQNGDLPRIESPDQAKDAILAAVRRMYQKRSLIAKMARKFSRFGSSRVMKKSRQESEKALESSDR